MRRPDPMLVAGIGLATFVLLLSFIGPLLWPVDPFALGPHSVLSRPSLAHPAGTDDLGRDSLARLISGGATTLTVAIPSAIIAFLAACFYGFAAALGPAWLDRLLACSVEIADAKALLDAGTISDALVANPARRAS